MKRFFLVFLALLVLGSVHANYLRIQNVALDQAAGTVSFDIAWDNSWRIDSLGSPNHWDAAWVFVKFRECNAPVTTDWTHAQLSTILTNHIFSGLEPTLSDGSAVGIDAVPNNTGAMLRRTTNGLFRTGTFSSVTLRLANLPATGDYEVRVFGVEMVYVPEGAYLLGGNSESRAFTGPLTITSEASIALTGGSATTLPAAYPKGFAAFYCMKYEISQHQYAAFLNTILPNAQAQHFPNEYNDTRHRINGGGTPPNIYFSDRPDRACNFVSWTSLLAYLDWAALRPMSDTEYEKASRGFGPYVGGYAWGTNDIVAANTLGTPEDGTELVLNANANANYSNTAFTGGDGGRGPLRVGIYATNTTSNRIQTGASYFGIMELSGNLWEQTVPVYNDPLFTAYDGQWGDGSLDATSHLANVPNWPNLDCGANPTTCYHALRGGGYSDVPDRLRISDRSNYYYRYDYRYANIGGRGVR